MLTPRAGNIKDSKFIMACLLSGARAGSFAVDAENSVCVKSMKAEVRMILARNRMAMNVPAQTVIYSERGQRIGFAILVSHSEDNRELELYALAIGEQFRGKGFGAWILDDVLRNIDYVRCYARCSATSVRMQQMLQRRSFRQIGTNELGYSIMVHERPVVQQDGYSAVVCAHTAG